MVKMIRHPLVLVAILLLAACGNTVTDAEYVQQAQDSLDKGDLETAAVELKNALQKNSNNPQARRLLGVVQYEVGNMPGAEKELRRARELGVADQSVLPLLARALFGQQKYEALDALSPERLPPGAAKAEVQSAQALGKLARGKLKEAQELVDSAVATAPDSPYVNVVAARLLAYGKDYEAARQKLERVLELNPKFAPAWSLMGELQKSQDKMAEAEESYTRAIDNRRANTADMLSRATVRIRLKKYDAAQKDVDILLKRLPKHPGVNYAQGLLDLETNKLQAAKDAFELSLRANDRQLLPKYYLSLINLRLGNIEQADDYGERALAAAPGSISVRELLAAVKIKKKEFDQAEDLVRPIVSARKDDVKAMELMAVALIGQGKTADAIPLLEKVVARNPESAIAELRLGAALLAVGRNDEGVVHVRKSLKNDPGLNSARLLLVRHYFRRNELDKAMQVAQAYRDDQPDNPEAWSLIGGLLLKKGDERDAVKMFERAREIAPGYPDASFYLASFAVKAKDFEKARRYYEDILAHHEDHLETLLKLASLDALQDKEEDMVGHLTKAASAHPKAVAPHVMLARYYLLKGEADKVAPLMVELSEEDKDSPAVLDVMAKSQLALNQYSDAKYSLEKLIKQRPKSADLHFLLSQAYAGLKDVKATEQELHTTIALAPEDLQAHLALARLAMMQGQKDTLEEQIRLLEKLAPENPDVLYLKAAQAGSEGDQKRAKGLLEKVFTAAPNTRTMLSVARQKRVMGDPEGALAVQEKWTKEHPDDLWASLALAGSYGEENDPDKAIAEYKRILQKDDTNVVALNGLAWYLRDAQPAKALEYAQRASELAPESADVLDTLAMVQLSNEQFEIARRTIERALAKAPGNSAMQYHRALIYSAAGKIGAAVQGLKELLGTDADFAERGDAQELLNKLESE